MKIHMNKSRYQIAAFGAALAATLALAAPALAQTTTTPPMQGPQGGGHMMMHRAPGVFGTVSAVNGTTLTVTSKAWTKPGTTGTSAATTYTVDASSATVTKNNAASTLGSVAVGDMVMVQGAVNGTSVVATKINDGMGGMMMHGKGGTPPAQIIQGNGEPVIGGAVTAINGNTLTVTNKSNVTYSVDASSATVEKANATSTLANITVGDNVVVQGTVNGTSVSATSVIDQGVATSANAGGTTPGKGPGFLGAIGGFFQHIFGFF
jgi:membrane-bound inhibitor of C-type lysozyme